MYVFSLSLNYFSFLVIFVGDEALDKSIDFNLKYKYLQFTGKLYKGTGPCFTLLFIILLIFLVKELLIDKNDCETGAWSIKLGKIKKVSE